MVPLAQAAGSAPCYHPFAEASRATTPLGSGWLRRASTAHRAARAVCTLAAPGQRAVARAPGRLSVQAAGALHPPSMCSVCAAVHRSSLSEIGLEMCVPIFLAPWQKQQ